MPQVVGSIPNGMHNHTFCFYRCIPGTYQDIPGLTLYILLQVFDGKVQTSMYPFVTRTTQYDIPCQHDTPIYFNVPVHTTIYLLVPLVTILSHCHVLLEMQYVPVCSMHELPVSSKTRNPQDRDQWYKKVCTGMYEKGLSCTIAWYILGCTEYAQVCLEYVPVYTYMYLTQAHWTFHCG
jgi:hypothetical protein